MKRILCAILTIILAVATVFPVGAENEALYFGKITATMPEISAEIKGVGYDAAEISATLGTEQLKINGVQSYDVNTHNTRVYMLVDLSTSMYYYFDAVKSNILNYVDTMGDSDSLVLITFGQNSVDVILDGSETEDEIISTVSALECNEYGTMFYEALSKAYDLANSSISSFDREYVLAFSDGIDEQVGNITYDEIAGNYSTHNLPLYAACFDNYDQNSIDKFGELSRSSGGSLKMMGKSDDFEELLEEINDVSLVSMTASSNYVDGTEKLLSVKVGDVYIEKQIPVVRSLSDTTAPTVVSSTFDETTCVMTVRFSESVNDKVNDLSAYKITDSDGKTVSVMSVEYNENDFTVKITCENIPNGNYTLTFAGVTDLSQEGNKVTDTVSFFVTQGLYLSDDRNTDRGLPLWGLLLIVFAVIILVVGIVLLIVLSSRKNQSEDNNINISAPVIKEVEEEQIDYIQSATKVKHHIMVNHSKKVRLTIKTGNISEQSVETTIQSSLIVGRSNTCDIFIDDTKLSRQHFVIECDAEAFYIMDLQSRNGTLLNGYRVNGRHSLKSGDKIIAGLSDIQFTIVG